MAGRRKGTPELNQFRELRGTRQPGPAAHEVKVDFLNKHRRAQSINLNTSWQRYALNASPDQKSHVVTEGNTRHPQGEFTGNHLRRAHSSVGGWPSVAVATVPQASSSMGSLPTKTGLHASKEEHRADAAIGPGPGCSRPSKAVLSPVISSMRSGAKYSFGRRSEAPLHLSGPYGGVGGRMENQYGTGGILGPGAGITSSPMGKQNFRSMTSGLRIAMGGRNHTFNAPEWQRHEPFPNDLRPAEHSQLGPASRYGMSEGWGTGAGPG